ncbi:MAG TPA: hypothetical protein VHV55_07375 [Pirellulales bacterium]|jgi:hypothetical protein|nr:hypothetical protein [Pirellulales bacterium]
MAEKSNQSPTNPRKMPWILRADQKSLARVFWTALATTFAAIVVGLRTGSIAAFVLAGCALVAMFLIWLEDWAREMDE